MSEEQYVLNTSSETIMINAETDGTVFIQIDETGQFSQGNAYLTVEQARELAKQLLYAANHAESGAL